MKFIKSYESFDISQLKKYAIWKWNNYKDKTFNGYDIIEIVDTTENNDDIVWCKDIYTYNETEKLIFINSSKQSSFSLELYSDCIIYVSDNLNDCLEYLKIIIESEKYNL